MAYAIDQLRPSLVVVENVRGLLSAYAHSDVESCPICLGDGPDGALRALGAVVGDLAGLGYECRWGGVRASDAGAPHGRFRVFIVACPADAEVHEQREPAEPRPVRHEPGASVGDSTVDFGPYAAAVRRWEHVLDRPAPPPTEAGRNGPRLSPRFVEWMQGLPDGWVTGVPGLSRPQQLKVLGNGVVPQQAVLALRLLLDLPDGNQIQEGP